MSSIKSYFSDLVVKAKNATTSAETQRIKKKLIKIGLILTVIGAVGALACTVLTFLLFLKNIDTITAVDPMYGFPAQGFNFSFLITFFLIPLFAVCMGIGIIALNCGLGIVVAKASVDFIDGNKYCPHCGDKIEKDELYCDKCGNPLYKSTICKDCGTENALDAKFCKTCGKQL